MYEFSTRYTRYDDRGRTTIPKWFFFAVSRATIRTLAETSLEPFEVAKQLPLQIAQNSNAKRTYDRLPNRTRQIVFAIVFDVLKRSRFISVEDRRASLSRLQTAGRTPARVPNNVMSEIYNDYEWLASERPHRYLVYFSQQTEKEAVARANDQDWAVAKIASTRAMTNELKLREVYPNGQHPDIRPTKSYAKQRVYYATNRKRLTATSFGAEREDKDPIHSFGSVDVSIPNVYVRGKVERPGSFLGIEVRRDRFFGFVVQRDTFRALSKVEFLRAICQTELADVPTKRVLVFVHGYRVSFDDSIRRTAQLAHDLGFSGSAIAFSWPSQANIADYFVDANNAMASSTFLDDVLLSLSQIGIDEVHVLSHSMGVQIVVDASRDYVKRANMRRLGPFVLAAPDIDRGIFQQRSSDICGVSANVILYASRNDLALLASKRLHKYARAGDASVMLICEGVESIDATHINTDWLGHGFYCGSLEMLEDIRLACSGKPPPRTALERVRSPTGEIYWQFLPPA